MNAQHTLVVGAGVIGIACGIHLLQRGCRVTLVDPAEPGSMTSSGNAGAFAFTEVMPIAAPGVMLRAPLWLLDRQGPLAVRWGHLPALLPWLWRFYRSSSHAEVERISRALGGILGGGEDDTRALLAETGAGDLYQERGAITVYESPQSMRRNALEWRIKRRRGIEARELTADEIKQMEPELANVACGMYTPRWFNCVDPFVLTKKLAARFQAMGGVIRGDRVRKFVVANGVVGAVTLDQDTLSADHVVIAAGVWSRDLCGRLGDPVLLESERGYNTTFTEPGIQIQRQIIFGDHKFVVSRIGAGLRVGGAAEFAGIDTPPNYKRSETLARIAKKYLPNLDIHGGSQWMGHRSATPDSLPVISPSAHHHNVFYAFGHGHLGLTLAATTGKIIAGLVSGESPEIDLKPFRIQRFS